MSNNAPRAVIEDMVDRFGKMHPDLDIKLTINVRDTMIEILRHHDPIMHLTLLNGMLQIEWFHL